MRWAGHVARMGEERGCIWSCWGNRREGDHWVDLGLDGCIILGWISRRWVVSIWTGLGWSRIETGGGRCGCGNEPAGSVKCGEFLD